VPRVFTDDAGGAANQQPLLCADRRNRRSREGGRHRAVACRILPRRLLTRIFDRRAGGFAGQAVDDEVGSPTQMGIFTRASN